MEEFGSTLEMCKLIDIGLRGYQFTWNKKRPRESNTKEILDRAVANTGWRDRFPASTVTHLHSHASDHLPLVLQAQTDQRFRSQRAHGFRFKEAWLLWEDCERRVDEAWIARSGSGSV